MNKIKKFAFAASLVLASSFLVSCGEHSFEDFWEDVFGSSSSAEEDGGGSVSSSSRGGGSSSSDGGSADFDGSYAVGTYLTKTKWAQGVPYRNNTPVINGEASRAGCVVIGMAQAMKYYEHPKGALKGMIPEYETRGNIIPAVDLNGFAFDWENMPIRINSNSGATQIDAVATLIDVAGRAIRTMFNGSSGGGVNGGYVEQAMVGIFGYDPSLTKIFKKDYSDSEWKSILRQQIEQGLIVVYRGNQPGNTSSNHAWVVDGYNDKGQFHMNWGWGGTYDGFYNLDSLTPGSYNFNEGQAATINVKPGAGALEGDGTEASPYMISTAEELAFIAAKLSKAGDFTDSYDVAHYKLKNDITLKRVNWSGSWSEWPGIGYKDRPFKGVFDGNHKVIKGLTIVSTSQNTGLFNYIEGGTVKNLGLEDVNISGTSNVGGIAGYMGASSAISNCYVTGVVTGISASIGGVAGNSDNSLISNCYSTATVSSPQKNNIGGLAGRFVSNSAIKNSAALNNKVIGSGSSVGRITGSASASGGTWANNIAFSRMLNESGSTVWNNTTSAKNGGEDITAEQIRADGSLGGRFTSADGWTAQNGKLPGFGRALDLPEHLR